MATKTIGADPDIKLSGLQIDFWEKFHSQNLTVGHFTAFLKLSKKQRERLSKGENPYWNIPDMSKIIFPAHDWKVKKNISMGAYDFDKIDLKTFVKVTTFDDYFSTGYREMTCGEVIKKLGGKEGPQLVNHTFLDFVFENSDRFPITKEWAKEFKSIYSLGTIYNNGLGAETIVSRRYTGGMWEFGNRYTQGWFEGQDAFMYLV